MKCVFIYCVIACPITVEACRKSRAVHHHVVFPAGVKLHLKLSPGNSGIDTMSMLILHSLVKSKISSAPFSNVIVAVSPLKTMYLDPELLPAIGSCNICFRSCELNLVCLNLGLELLYCRSVLVCSEQMLSALLCCLRGILCFLKQMLILPFFDF